MYNNFGNPNLQYNNPNLQYGYTNPTLEMQINRLNQLRNFNNPQYPQVNPQNVVTPQQTQSIGNMVKPVTSIEEVKAITPDFSGAKMYFEDTTNGNMYIKYLGLNGLPILDIYTKQEMPTINNADTNSQEFVSRNEFEELKNKMQQYENVFNELIGGNNNDKSNANDTDA